MNQDTFIARLARHIQSGYDLTKQELTIVFPNKRAAFYLRDAFKANCNQTLWLPQMISIEEAITQWSGITLTDNIDLLFELIDIDAQLHNGQNGDLNAFGSQAAQMAKDFDEIDQYGVDAEKVFEFVSDDKELQIWNIDNGNNTDKEKEYLRFFKSLHTYYLELRKRLSQQGKGYYGMITRYLKDLPESELLTKVGDNNIIFAGFNALTTTEEHIVNTLVRNGKAEILFDYDSYYLNNPDIPENEAGKFGRKHQDNHPSWLKDGIFNHLLTEQKNIHIVSASGNALQAKALQAKLQDNHDENQAVILADESLLIPVLNSIPNTYSGFNVSMGYPMTKTPVNQLIKAYFSLCRRKRITRTINDNGSERQAEGWYIWPVLNLMDLELVKIIFPKKETEAFNRWKYEAVKDGKFIFEDNDIEALKQMPHIQAFLKIILAPTDDKTPADLLENISLILAFVAKMVQTEDGQKEHLFLLNQVSEIGRIVSRLQKIVQQNSRYVNDLRSLETLYRLLTSESSLKLNSSSTEGLQIMGLLETRNLDFERLHLFSVNEGILPPDKSRGSFIPQFIRRACHLPIYDESQAVIAYHFYRLLQNGKEIYLYYNDLGDSSGGEASRFILQIKNELAQHKNIHLTEESFSSVAEPSLGEKALCAKKDEHALERLQYLLKDDEKGLSPSSLSTYLDCSLKYFFKYIVNIKDKSIEEETGADVVGKIIHGTLELLFANYRPTDGKLQIIDKTMFDKTIRPQWENKMAKSFAKNTPKGFPDVGFNYLKRVTIELQLKNYLNYLSDELKHGSLVILKTEGDLKTQLQTEHGVFIIRGIADRIDQFDGLTRIIDYKTGKVENANVKVPVRHHSESDLEYLKQIPEKALQLLLYKYMYLKDNPSLSPEKITAAIHSLKHVNDIEFNLSQTTPTKNDKDADADFLSDDTFIQDMEALLKAAIDEMLDPKTAFTQTDDRDTCKHCDFKLICKRTKSK